jgi:hypothetical protein
MKPESQNHEQPIAESAWISSVELGAGIYFLEGRTHMAGHSTPAERSLLARGALLVASIRFDRAAHEAFLPGHPLRELDVREALNRFLAAPHGS